MLKIILKNIKSHIIIIILLISIKFGIKINYLRKIHNIVKVFIIVSALYIIIIKINKKVRECDN